MASALAASVQGKDGAMLLTRAVKTSLVSLLEEVKPSSEISVLTTGIFLISRPDDQNSLSPTSYDDLSH